MHPETIRYLHSLARLTTEAGPKGTRPLPPDRFMDFFMQVTRDPTLDNEAAWRTFERCLDFERQRPGGRNSISGICR